MQTEHYGQSAALSAKTPAQLCATQCVADRCDRLDLSSSGVAGVLLCFGIFCDLGFMFRAVLAEHFGRVDSCFVSNRLFSPFSSKFFFVVVLLLRSTKFVGYLTTNETSALASNCVPVLALLLPLPFPPCYPLLSMP